ncbi:phospholipase carboxylesterase domain protein [Ichthyophthirius multifiliis]|uniref:Phospholipase carboxylesterase domain protein n=1 Tax=Ichthyophthirius multifiliis TaxID=5932 RepID=G0QJ90_ICHMU|nr:phospholipase carboxylesterase domain protein [Ichthyophthirius multifiliis]EGR34719.1 phospholipase carboxylesterase domain protein [Ichthyophthirius multifiliis]|eukprot:XP_004040023.1 phospholipase carboxylesterase domain protein [Ichthyophthirius multifiliis]
MLYLPVVQGMPKSQDLNPIGFRTPFDVGIKFENITIYTSDNIKLHGWICKLENSQNVPTVIYFHENAGNIGTRIHYLKKYQQLANVNIVLIAYRGYSNSDGSPSEQGLQNDSIAILNHIFSRNDINTEQIFIHGRSLGGALTIYVAAEHNYNVKGYIIENTFTSISDMVDIVFPQLKYIQFIKNKLITNKWESINRIDKIQKPILFIASLKDQLVPSQQMYKLYEKCKSQYKNMYTIQDGDHNNSWNVDPYNYFNQVQKFMNISLQK